MRAGSPKFLSTVPGAVMGMVLAGALVAGWPTASTVTAADSPGDVHVAVSSLENGHIHSIVLRAEDIAAFLSNMNTNSEVVTLQSSSGLDGGAPNGVSHSHAVNLTRGDLIRLRDSGSLTVQSEVSQGHSHLFSFVVKEQCPGMAVPSSTPSASPSGVPSGTPSGSPSGGPSTTPSATVSPFPAPSLIPGP